MTVATPRITGPNFITRSFIQSLLPERSQSDWDAIRDEAAQNGFSLCSMGDGRWVSPRFLRRLESGPVIGLCPDKAGRHRGIVGPTGYAALLEQYGKAQPIFGNDEIVDLAAVEAILKPGDMVVTLASALKEGFVAGHVEASENAEATEAPDGESKQVVKRPAKSAK